MHSTHPGLLEDGDSHMGRNASGLKEQRKAPDMQRGTEISTSRTWFCQHLNGLGRRFFPELLNKGPVWPRL